MWGIYRALKRITINNYRPVWQKIESAKLRMVRPNVNDSIENKLKIRRTFSRFTIKSGTGQIAVFMIKKRIAAIRSRLDGNVSQKYTDV